MAEDLHHDQSSSIKTEEAPAAVETQARGWFDFMGKKEEQHKPQDEAIATEFEKVHVSESEHKKEEEKKPSLIEKKMAEDLHHDQSSSINTEEAPVAVKTQVSGWFDSMGKKEEQHKPQDEAIATEFEKVHVSESEQKKEEEKKPSLIEKLHRSDSTSSSSSSDEEEEGEGGEKKKKKKGPKEKIKDKISGDHEEGEKKAEKHDEVDTSVPVEKVDEPSHAEPTNPEEKKGFLDKIKDKLPGHHNKKTGEVPPPAAAECHSPDGEGKEKKGFLEKIKGKIPGYHAKSEEEKEKETTSH